MLPPVTGKCFKDHEFIFFHREKVYNEGLMHTKYFLLTNVKMAKQQPFCHSGHCRSVILVFLVTFAV